MGRRVKQILAVRKYKAGYHTVKYIADGDEWGCADFEMNDAFTNDTLEYIGETKWAYRLTHKWGLTQIQSRSGRKPIENRTIDKEAKRLLEGDFMRDYSYSPCCQIGFNEKEQKWYGWSHRAIYGFGIGSTSKKGDCSYKPSNKEDFIREYVKFWSGDNHLDTHFAREEEVDGMKGCWIEWTYDDKTPNEKIRGTISGAFAPYPDEWGRGEWTATTLEDAKLMAMDFADGVS